MKKLLPVLFLFSIVKTSFGNPIKVGEKQINLPAPTHHILVTRQMPDLFSVGQSMSDSITDLMAIFIPESDYQLYQNKELAAVDRICLVKVPKTVKNKIVGKDEFNQLKSTAKENNQKMADSVQADWNQKIDSQHLKNPSQIDLSQLKVNQILPLKPHQETNDLVTFSSFTNHGPGADEDEDLLISTTTTYLNVSGKIIYLFCFAPKDQILSTRKISAEWSQDILNNNDVSPEQSSSEDSEPFWKNFPKVGKKAIFGIVLGVSLLWLGKILRKKYK